MEPQSLLDDRKPLWTWGCDKDGNVTLNIVSPVALQVEVSRRDIELMESAGNAGMREAHLLMALVREDDS